MSTYNFDVSSDYSGRQLLSMFDGVDLPEYVKAASLEELQATEKVASAGFADEQRRIYPINNEANVFVSNAFFMDKRADIVRVYGESYASQLEASIKEAAALLGIEADLEAFNTKAQVKQASDYSETSIVNLLGVSLYPVKTAQDVVSGMEHFATNLSNFPFETRVEGSKNFIKAAEAYGIDEVPDILAKYAGMFFSDPEHLRTELWRRSTKLASESNRQLYKQAAEDIDNIQSVEEVMKLAEICYNIENMEGLYDKPKVASVLGDPVDMLFSLGIEKVAEALNVVDVHGSMYKLDDLTKVAKEVYEEAFGFELDPQDTVKLAEVLPTMPRSDMALFCELSGVKPV